MPKRERKPKRRRIGPVERILRDWELDALHRKDEWMAKQLFEKVSGNYKRAIAEAKRRGL